MTLKLPKAAFRLDGIAVRLDKLLPTRLTGEMLRQTTKYRSLLASIREVGLIEPLSVYPQKGGRYLILDGHARAEALRELGEVEVPCLIATSDEGYTYNQKVNRVAPIQANRMILKALEAGVPEERIARALNMAVNTVKNNKHMLKGICDEAIEVLRDRQVPQRTLDLLKAVKPLRQIEMAEIMVSAGAYAGTYAYGLVLATPKDQLVDPEKPRKTEKIRPDDLARIERECRAQEKHFRQLDESYNENVVALTIARGYLTHILKNGRTVAFLAQRYREFLTEFQKITEETSLDG